MYTYNLDDGLRKWKALFERKKNERERGLLPFPIMYLHKVWFYKDHFPFDFGKVWRMETTFFMIFELLIMWL